MYLYFYIGDFTTSALENMANINLSLLEDLLNSVSNLNAHRVIDFQEPTSTNNYTWYRKYADGWVEQGSFVTLPSEKYVDVVFPITMANTSYTPMVTGSWSDTATGQNEGVQSTTTTGMRVTGSYATVTVWWRVEGMAA